MFFFTIYRLLNFSKGCLTIQNSSYLDFFATLSVDRNSPTGSFNLILQARFDQTMLTSVNIPYNVITSQPDGIVSEVNYSISRRQIALELI